MAQGKLTKGDLVVLDIDLRPEANDFLLGPRTDFRVRLVPDPGPPQALALSTPMTLRGQHVVDLK
ncbi:MAG: hypothetical protein LC624_08400 [Halobacteriales archaeon]|nr:hypothetical protein [Halobacteriales archaeon]